MHIIDRCGACKGLVGSYSDLALKYTNAVFLSVDVEKCEGTGLHYRVNAMPTFVLIRNKQKLDQIEGANKDALETKIKSYYTDAGADNCGVKGMVSTESTSTDFRKIEAFNRIIIAVSKPLILKL